MVNFFPFLVVHKLAEEWERNPISLDSSESQPHRREFQAMSFAPRFFVQSLERFAKSVVISKCRDKQQLT
jgi:hypothetical protein